MAKNATEHQAKEEDWEEKENDWKLSERAKAGAGTKFMNNLENTDPDLTRDLKDSLEGRRELSHRWQEENSKIDWQTKDKILDSFKDAMDGMNKEEKEYIGGELARAIVGMKIRDEATFHSTYGSDPEGTLHRRLDQAEKKSRTASWNRTQRSAV